VRRLTESCHALTTASRGSPQGAETIWVPPDDQEKKIEGGFGHPGVRGKVAWQPKRTCPYQLSLAKPGTACYAGSQKGNADGPGLGRKRPQRSFYLDVRAGKEKKHRRLERALHG